MFMVSQEETRNDEGKILINSCDDTMTILQCHFILKCVSNIYYLESAVSLLF